MAEVLKFPTKPLSEHLIDDLLEIIEGIRGGHVLNVACVIVGKEDDGTEVIFTQSRGTASFQARLSGAVLLKEEILMEWRQAKVDLEEA